MDDRDPWSVLGVAPGACETSIKAAFRERMKQCHPDLNRHPDQRISAESETKRLNAALDQVLNPGKIHNRYQWAQQRRQGTGRGKAAHFDEAMSTAERHKLYTTRQPWRVLSTRNNLRVRLAVMVMLVSIGTGSKIASQLGLGHWGASEHVSVRRPNAHS